MKKGCLISMLVLAALLAVVVALVVRNAGTWLEENRGRIASQVSKAIGREVGLGSIGISLRGALGARIDGLTVGDDPAFSQEPFLRADSVRVSVALLPALLGRIEVRAVVLERPVIRIIRSASGLNIDSLGKSASKTATAQRMRGPAASARGWSFRLAAAARAEGTAAPALPLRIDEIRIDDGEIHFSDRTANPPADWQIRHVAARIENVAPDRAAGVDLRAALLGAEKDFAARGSLGPLGGDIPLDIEARLGPVMLASLRNNPFLAASVPPDLEVDRPVQLSAHVSGTAASPKADVQADLTEAGLAYGEVFAKPSGTPLRLHASAARREGVIDLQPVELQLGDLSLRIAGKVTPGPPPSADLTIESNESSLEGWNRMLPALREYAVNGRLAVRATLQGRVGGGRMPAVRGTASLRDVSLQLPDAPAVHDITTEVRFTENTVVLPKTTFSVGDAPMSLEAQARSLRPLDATAELRSQRLPLAAIGAGKPEEVVEELVLRAVARQSGDALPVVRATLRSRQGSVRGVTYRSAEADVASRDRVVTVERFAVEVFGGTVQGSAKGDLRNTQEPSFEVDTRIEGVDLGKALGGRLPAAAEAIRGRLDSDLQVAGSGSQWARIQQTLSGKGTVAVLDGALRRVNLAEEVLRGLTSIPGLTALLPEQVRARYPKLFGAADTEFKSLRGDLQITEGRIQLERLRLDADDFGIRGRGVVGLDRSIDVQATFVASEALTRDLLRSVREARVLVNAESRLEVPFGVRGVLPAIRPAVDAAFIREALQKVLLQKGLETLLGKGKREEQGESEPTVRPEQELLRKGLEGLFGR